MKCVLAGYGEIGKAVAEVYGGAHEIAIMDGKQGYVVHRHQTDILLVAIPFNSEFVGVVTEYQKIFNPIATIIFSTVAIGTTEQIPDAVHSPVEGKHPNLAESIRLMPRWVGGQNETAVEFLELFHPVMRVVRNPKATEALKLMSTSKYGVNIEFARYQKQVSDAVGMDYELVKAFDQDYNELYRELGYPQYQRYILDAPVGNTGGHCVVPNSKILDAKYPSVFLKEIYKDKEDV